MTRVNSKIKNKNIDPDENIDEEIDFKFKLLLKIMSWVVGVCFVSLIILPLFDFYLVDIIVKALYFLGLINLILFAILEFFAQNIKVFLSRKKI